MKVEATFTPAQNPDDENFLGYARVLLDELFVVHSVRVQRGKEDPIIVRMPVQRRSNGEVILDERGHPREITHPINKDGRALLQSAVEAAYRDSLS